MWRTAESYTHLLAYGEKNDDENFIYFLQKRGRRRGEDGKICMENAFSRSGNGGKYEIHLEVCWERQNGLQIAIWRWYFPPKCTGKGEIHFKRRWKDKIQPKMHLKKRKLLQKSSKILVKAKNASHFNCLGSISVPKQFCHPPFHC